MMTVPLRTAALPYWMFCLLLLGNSYSCGQRADGCVLVSWHSFQEMKIQSAEPDNIRTLINIHDVGLKR